FPIEKELAYHKELLGEPQPPFSTLEPKIKRGDPWSLKIPCVIGTVYTGHAYIDLQSPVNIMSRAYYNKIREKSFQARRNPYQPYKFCNFVGRAKNVHIFIGCFVYVVDFMILEDLGSIIDSGLSEVVLGQPFAHTSKLTYDESLGLIRFAQRDDEVVFRMPQRTKELDLVSSLEKDKFEAFFVENLKVRKKGLSMSLKRERAEEEMQEREGDPEDTNTIAYIEERRDTPLLERKDITAVSNLGLTKITRGIEWLDVINL
ncbi:protein kinase-like domain, concanavalin A-like lectin/glucanase domain protein, partial [Tanacetum coccineum]